MMITYIYSVTQRSCTECIIIVTRNGSYRPNYQLLLLVVFVAHIFLRHTLQRVSENTDRSDRQRNYFMSDNMCQKLKTYIRITILIKYINLSEGRYNRMCYLVLLTSNAQ